MQDAALFPPLEPYAQGRLEVDGGHFLYFEQSGNPVGMPVLFLHGGPGSGCRPWHRQLFDPVAWRVILFDQRGAGRSRPAGGTEANTSADLVADIERLRAYLGIERWHLFGGSWGAALGLLYAQGYPQRVRQLILRGTFLARRVDLDWFVRPDGAARRFPEAYRRFVAGFTSTEQRDPVDAYWRRLTEGDDAERRAAARQWAQWEETLVTHPGAGGAIPAEPSTEPPLGRFAVALHYARHRYFLGPDGVLAGAERLSGVRGAILHGTADVLCPLAAAAELRRAWPDSRLVVVPRAGHAQGSPALLRAHRKLLDSVLRDSSAV